MNSPLPNGVMHGEAERIRAEYQRRAREIPADYYSLANPGVLFAYQQRVRATLELLTTAQLLPLDDLRILDIGCGRGDWLADFESWGASRERLAGIDLDAERTAIATTRMGGADIRVGDASVLPWRDQQFDLVVLSTVFSSILDETMRTHVAAETVRVLKPAGVVLWYDFFVDNPSNRSVRGVRRADIERFFPGFHVELRRSTLAPPIARRVAPYSWFGATLLEALTVLNTHHLGVLYREKRVRCV
jgi:ubiquinone/menaquinone biosynthesis C-methylase UbiE